MEYIGIVLILIFIVLLLQTYGVWIVLLYTTIAPVVVMSESNAWPWVITGAGVVALITTIFRASRLFWLLFLPLFLVNLASLVIGISSNDGMLMLLGGLNILLHWCLYRQYCFACFNDALWYVYGLNYYEARRQVRNERIAEFAFRFGLGHLLGVPLGGFLLKPITDEYGASIFGTTDLRQIVAGMTRYRHSTNVFSVLCSIGWGIAIGVLGLAVPMSPVATGIMLISRLR